MKAASFLLPLLPALLLGRPATAQDQPKLQFGLKAGLTSTGYRKQDSFSTDERLLGAAAGGLMRYTFSRNQRWAVQPELQYAGKGGRFTRFKDADGNATSYTDRIHFLDLPVLLRYRYHGLFLEAGPQLSFPLGKPDDLPYEVLRNMTGRTDYAPVQLSYALGLGYELPNGLSLNLRYADDTSNLYWPGTTGGVRNSVLQAQVGYVFGGK